MVQRAAIYIRTASLDQHVTNLQIQLEKNRGYVHEQEYFLVDTFTDVGSGINLDRPGLHKLLLLAENNGIDIVIVTSPDRLSRKLEQFQEIMQKLEKHHVMIECSQAALLNEFSCLENDVTRLRTNDLLHIENTRRAISQSHKKLHTTKKF